MPAWQISKPHRADAGTNQAFHVVADCEKHAANLAIDALSQDDPQSCRRDGIQPRNLRTLPVEENTAQQFRGERRIPWSIQRHFVFFLDLLARMNELLGELAVIGEDEKSFTLRIQPADVKEPREFVW
jgi:hypothetical protein